MALITDLRTRIRDFTNRSATILTDAICDDFVNTAMSRMQNSHAWIGQETSVDVTYNSTDDGKAIGSSGFISERQVSLKDTVTTDPSARLTPIDKVVGGRWAWIENLVDDKETDTVYPQASAPGAGSVSGRFYYIWKGLLFIVPNPSQEITTTVDYYLRLADLNVGNTSNFFSIDYPEVLKWGALVDAWTFLHEDQRSASAEQMFARLLAAGIKNDASLSMSGPPRARGT